MHYITPKPPAETPDEKPDEKPDETPDEKPDETKDDPVIQDCKKEEEGSAYLSGSVLALAAAAMFGY